MKPFQFLFAVTFMISGCVPNEEGVRGENSNAAKGKPKVIVEKSNDSFYEKISTRKKDIKNDSFLLNRIYNFKYENDTLLQKIEIIFLNKNRVSFRIESVNKQSKNECVFQDTAFRKDDFGAAQYEDEEGFGYSAVEYFMTAKPFLVIGVDMEEYDRLEINGNKENIVSICKKDCPLLSVAVMHRVGSLESK